jgi:hypothetical protein
MQPSIVRVCAGHEAGRESKQRLGASKASKTALATRRVSYRGLANDRGLANSHVCTRKRWWRAVPDDGADKGGVKRSGPTNTNTAHGNQATRETCNERGNSKLRCLHAGAASTPGSLKTPS